MPCGEPVTERQRPRLAFAARAQHSGGMRKILTLIVAAALAASPVLAADWGQYENARFGYEIAVPPDFNGGGEADNGDGQVFTSKDGTQTLRVYGGNILEDDFEREVGRATAYLDGEGWTISYQRTTPSWASYSGSKQGFVLYVRSIALCEGTQYATFEYQYPTKAIADADPVVEKLVRSLRATEAGASC